MAKDHPIGSYSYTEYQEMLSHADLRRTALSMALDIARIRGVPADTPTILTDAVTFLDFIAGKPKT